MRGEGGGGQVELIAQLAHRQPLGAGLDQLAEGGQPRFVTEGIEGGNSGGGFHDSIFPEISKYVKSCRRREMTG
jgi:hypothetical protein